MGRGPLSVSLRGSPPSTFNLARCPNRSAVNRPQEPQALHRQERRIGHSSLPKTNPASKGETTGSAATLKHHFGGTSARKNRSAAKPGQVTYPREEKALLASKVQIEIRIFRKTHRFQDIATEANRRAPKTQPKISQEPFIGISSVRGCSES